MADVSAGVVAKRPAGSDANALVHSCTFCSAGSVSKIPAGSVVSPLNSSSSRVNCVRLAKTLAGSDVSVELQTILSCRSAEPVAGKSVAGSEVSELPVQRPLLHPLLLYPICATESAELRQKRHDGSVVRKLPDRETEVRARLWSKRPAGSDTSALFHSCASSSTGSVSKIPAGSVTSPLYSSSSLVSCVRLAKMLAGSDVSVALQTMLSCRSAEPAGGNRFAGREVN